MLDGERERNYYRRCQPGSDDQFYKIASRSQSVCADEPKVFVVNEINVTDPVKYKTYAEQVPATLVPFGGSFVVRGGNPEALDGKIPGDRIVVVAFPSRAEAKAWHESPAYRNILTIRNAASTSTVYIVDSLQ